MAVDPELTKTVKYVITKNHTANSLVPTQFTLPGVQTIAGVYVPEVIFPAGLLLRVTALGMATSLVDAVLKNAPLSA